MGILAAIAALLLALLVVNLAWRWGSRRFQLPCPTWLAWGLEGPIMTRLFGTRSTLDRLDLRPGQRVLEIGCGPGRLLLPAARRISPGGEAVGVDIQPGMIERLEVAARAEGLANVRGIAADATTIELPAASFDVVLIALTLGEIPRREVALRRAYDLLKPGGVLAITELFPDPHFVSRRTVRRLAEDEGFRHAATRGNALFFTASFIKPVQAGGKFRAVIPLRAEAH